MKPKYFTAYRRAHPNTGTTKAVEVVLSSRYERLLEAVRAVYYSAKWSADRPVDEAALWTELRDAAGFEPGGSPK